MGRPKVSVIIPAYNQADFLGDAIRSVLDQTYKDFELVIVNDASTDHTHETVKQFSDPRIIYLAHETNKMLAAARNTGIRASSGEIITLLDADDIYHPQKLEKHIVFLDANPTIGVTYNPRFVLHHSRNTIRELVRPPLHVTLVDLVLGFPFAPSDMVVRRDWLFRVGLFDESFTAFSEDLDINCQLALAGCKFASVDKALNYRRYHAGRIIKNIPARIEAALKSLNKTFSDPGCPEDVFAVRKTALLNHYLIWSYIALSQNETSLGQTYITEALQMDPSIIQGKPCKLMHFFVNNCIADENTDHAVNLRQILVNLPKEAEKISEQYNWGVARGYLLKAISAVIWGRQNKGRDFFEQAFKLNAEIDDATIGSLTYQLLSYENEFGSKATYQVIKELSSYLTRFGGGHIVRRLFGGYSFNLAFQNYRGGNYKDVFRDIVNTLLSQPRYIANRGLWSILVRSISKQAVS